MFSVTEADAVSLLRAGGVVAIPTETVYGLAADITNSQAIEKIFITKQRPFFDPLIVHIAELAQMKSVIAEGIALPPLVENLAHEFWPGPLTMVLPKNKKLNSMITSGLETVGVRMPKHALTLQLIRDLGQPLAAPSANRFGRSSPTCADHVASEFGDSVPILDGGPCEVGIESTVIGFNRDFSKIQIYRPGAITQIMLRKFAPTETIISPVMASPGQLLHHYMPDLPLVLLKSNLHLTVDLYELIRSTLNLEYLHPSWMTLTDDPTLAARQLYSRLREAAQKDSANCIILARTVKKPYRASDPDTSNAELEQAISDRLNKAATLVI